MTFKPPHDPPFTIQPDAPLLVKVLAPDPALIRLGTGGEMRLTGFDVAPPPTRGDKAHASPEYVCHGQ